MGAFRKLVPSAVVTALLGISCSSSRMDSPAPEDFEMIRSSQPREKVAALPQQDQDDLSGGITDFGLRLYGALLNQPSIRSSNFACAPVSVSMAMSMAYAGARGTTATEMGNVLGYRLPPERLFPALNALEQTLSQRPAEAMQRAREQNRQVDPANYRMRLVNAVWSDRTLTFQPAYLDVLARHLGTGVHVADFRQQSERARQAINAWVSQETLQRIQNLLPQSAVTPDTRAILVNVTHLKMPWLAPFTKQYTQPASFTRLDGTKVSVPTMNGAATVGLGENDLVSVVSIPLEGGSLSFVGLLPKPGHDLWEVQRSMTGDTSQAWLTNLQQIQARLSLPKFTFTTPTISLRATLTALGMGTAFTADADFTGIATDRLRIDEVSHQTMVGVDEGGVEAAAATAVSMGATAVNGAPIVFDRPFLFGIVDVKTRTWLFLGHVLEPK